MAPTFLIAGATGNTGRAVVHTLSKLLQQSDNEFSDWRILALSRNASSPVARQLAALPKVQVEEQPWVEITPEWLRQHNVKRIFIASHNQPNQFAEEGNFLLAALNAGIEYLVRISTTATSVSPICPVYHARAHWAIEAMLGSPEYASMHWSSLQPNVFLSTWLTSAAYFIKNFKATGKQDILRLVAAEDAPVACVSSDEVGAFAARLLIQPDTSQHNNAKYVLHGAIDVTGRQIVELVEHHIGQKVQNVVFKDVSFVDQMVEQAKESKSLVAGFKFASVHNWEGKNVASASSDEFLRLAPPKQTPAEALQALLNE